MTKLNKIFNIPVPQKLVERTHPHLITDDKVGVEIELEGFGRHKMGQVDERWKVVKDGSLRNNGREFVFKEPMYGTDVVECLENLPHTFRELGVVPVISDRCSVHVHLDVRDLEYSQLLTLITTYLLCEPYFFAVGGEERRDNIYSMPLASSDDYLKRLGKALRGTGQEEGLMFRRHIDENVKYSAFNVAPVYTQGSVEFRHHRGTYHVRELIRWINMVLCIKRYTMRLGDTKITPDFIDEVVNGGYEGFIQQVFDGVDIPQYIDGWDNAARVAKRVAVVTEEPSDAPLLPLLTPEQKNLFFQIQHKVGVIKLDIGHVPLMREFLEGRKKKKQKRNTAPVMPGHPQEWVQEWGTQPLRPPTPATARARGFAGTDRVILDDNATIARDDAILIDELLRGEV